MQHITVKKTRLDCTVHPLRCKGIPSLRGYVQHPEGLKMD